jgi:predicted metal-dependent peptidase
MNELLESVLESLWRKSRFVSYFYQTVHFIEDSNIPTLALTVRESRLTLFFSGEFFSGISPEEIAGLLVHEMLHAVLNHDHRAYPSEDLYLQNISQDMVINSYLAGARKTFFSRKDGTGLAAELVLPAGLPIIPRDFITATGVTDPSWEDLYRWLKQQPRRSISEYLSESDASNGMNGRGPESISESLNRAFNFNPLLDGRSDMNTIRFSDMKGLVFTDNLDSVMPTGVHLFHDRERRMIIDARKTNIISLADKDRECAEERSYQDIKGIIERVRESDTASWERQLKSIVDFSAQSSEWTYTYGRFNRRYFANGIYSPGRVFKEQELITVAVDVSGSMVMTPSDIESAFGVIEQLMGKYRIHLVCLDEDLFVPERRGDLLAASKTPGRPFVYRRGDWKYIRTGSGGTTFFGPLFNRHMKGHREMLLVITDGFIYDLDKLKRYTPTIWVISESREEPFHAPFGQAVKIKSAEKVLTASGKMR